MDEFSSLFRIYVMRSARAVLATIDPNSYILPDEVRNRALHVLRFVLKVDEAWPDVRELLLTMAPKMEQAGYRDEWIVYLEGGVQQSQRCADRLAEAELHLQIGELHRLRSRFDLARQWLTTSADLFIGLGESQGQARALNQLAYLAWQQHRYEEAEELAQIALGLLDENDPERSTSFTRLGLVAIDRQQWQEAEEHHRTALQIRTAYGDQRKMAWSLQNLGLALRGQGHYTEAIACYQQAIATLEEIRDPFNCAAAQMNLGIVYYLNGQAAQALEMFALIDHTSRQLYDTHSLAKVFNNKGLVYLALREWEQAETAFSACIALHEKIGDTSFRLNALDGLGLVYLGQEQYDKAYTIFESTLAELPKIIGTPMYDYLVKVLPVHLEQAREKKSASG